MRVLVASLVLFSMIVAHAVDAVPAINALSFTPRQIQAGKDRIARADFEVNFKSKVTLKVLDEDGGIVAEVSKDCEAGRNQIAWEIKDNVLFDAPYYYQLEAVDAAGKKVVYAPRVTDGFKQLPALKVTPDFKSGSIEYQVPQLSMVRTRIFVNMILIRTLFDWEPRLAGTYKAVWDGLDQSGNNVLSSGTGFWVRTQGYTLPENAFFVTGTHREMPARSVEKQSEWSANPDLALCYMHARLPRERRKDPKINVEFLQADGKTPIDAKPQIPLEVSKPIKVRMTTPADVAQALNDERFEVCVYLDGTMLFEDEDGTVPFTFNFKPENFNPGVHTLTVTAISSFDHIGVVHREIKILAK